MEENTLTAYDNGLAYAHAFRTLLNLHMEARQAVVSLWCAETHEKLYKDFSLLFPALVNIY